MLLDRIMIEKNKRDISYLSLIKARSNPNKIHKDAEYLSANRTLLWFGKSEESIYILVSREP